MSRILVVGSYNTGLSMRVAKFPRSGETVLGSGYSEGPGGKGSNQAVAAARLSGQVSFVGRVGRDRFGEEALALWRREGVDCRHVKRSSKHTGLGFVVVDKSGANAISVDPGANTDLDKSDVEEAVASAPKESVLLLQLEVPLRIVRAAARAAKMRDMTVILNPAPPREARALPLDRIDVLTPNETEFSQLTNCSPLREGADGLIRRGAGSVIVTLGERGAYVRAGRESFRVAPHRVRVVDTTGAGDAFNGALAVALSEGMGIRAAVEFANAAGALTVTKREVVPALPTRRDVERMLQGMRG